MRHAIEFSDEEIARRRDELAKRMLNMPPRPLKTKAKANPSTKAEGTSRKQGTRVHKGKTGI